VAGELVAWEEPPAASADLQPEPGELTVLHEDDDLAVLDKPAGLVVHPGAGRTGGTLAHFLLARWPRLAGVGGPGRPGIVHRLDRGTSGALVVALTPAAYQGLSQDFAARRVAKSYLAIVYGVPKSASGRIDTPIGRHPTQRKQMTVRLDGRPAATAYRALATARGLALLDVDLATGRTHQIRVHLRSIRHPLVGDPVYGEARWKALPAALHGILRGFPRPALHAWRLSLRHPVSGEPLRVTAPPPADLVALWEGIAGAAWPPPGVAAIPELRKIT
jgi:23S rRNA pseudouridine1911/1915/1917 synthase